MIVTVDNSVVDRIRIQQFWKCKIARLGSLSTSLNGIEKWQVDCEEKYRRMLFNRELLL